jgi:hypothetical protein
MATDTIRPLAEFCNRYRPSGIGLLMASDDNGAFVRVDAMNQLLDTLACGACPRDVERITVARNLLNGWVTR